MQTYTFHFNYITPCCLRNTCVHFLFFMSVNLFWMYLPQGASWIRIDFDRIRILLLLQLPIFNYPGPITIKYFTLHTDIKSHLSSPLYASMSPNTKATPTAAIANTGTKRPILLPDEGASLTVTASCSCSCSCS